MNEQFISTLAKALPREFLHSQGAGNGVQIDEQMMTDFRAALNDALREDGREVKRQPHLVVPYSLEVEHISILEKVFPNFNYHFKDFEHTPSPLLTSMRYVAVEYLLKVMKFADAGVICIGCDFSSHVAKNRDYVHTCYPVTTPSDEADVISMCESVHLRAYMSNDEKASAAKDFYSGNRDKYMCTTPYNCRAKGDVLITDHFSTDFPMLQVAYTMIARGITRGYGFFFFVPEMLRNNQGFLSCIDMFYFIDRTKDTIVFVGKKAYSRRYVFRWSTYKEMATRSYYVIGKHKYLTEIIYSKLGVCCYRMVPVSNLSYGPEKVTHRLWYDQLDDYVEITLPKLKKPGLDTTDRLSYTTRKFLAPRRLFEYTLEKAESMPPHRLSRRDLVGYAFALNTRHIFFGQTAKCPTRLTFTDLNDLVTAVLFLAYRSRFEQSTITARLLTEFKYVRKRERGELVDSDDCSGQRYKPQSVFAAIVNTVSDRTVGAVDRWLRSWAADKLHYTNPEFLEGVELVTVSEPCVSEVFETFVDPNDKTLYNKRLLDDLRKFNPVLSGRVVVELLRDPVYLAQHYTSLPKMLQKILAPLRDTGKEVRSDPFNSGYQPTVVGGDEEDTEDDFFDTETSLEEQFDSDKLEGSSDTDSGSELDSSNEDSGERTGERFGRKKKPIKRSEPVSCDSDTDYHSFSSSDSDSDDDHGDRRRMVSRSVKITDGGRAQSSDFSRSVVSRETCTGSHLGPGTSSNSSTSGTTRGSKMCFHKASVNDFSLPVEDVSAPTLVPDVGYEMGTIESEESNAMFISQAGTYLKKPEDEQVYYRLSTKIAEDNGLYERVSPDYLIPKPSGRISHAANLAEFVFNQPIRPNIVSDPVSVLQGVYDEVFPGVSLVDYTYDSSQVNYGPLELAFSVRKMHLSTSAIEGLKPVTCYKSTLRTSGGLPRPKTTKETLIALKKRNLDVPFLEDNNSFEDVLEKGWEKCKKVFGNADIDKLLEDYGRNKLLTNYSNAATWTKKLMKPDVAKALEKVELFGLDLDKQLERYELMIKSEVKPKCSEAILAEYSALQTVVYHTKDINAAWSPVFMELRDRFKSLWKPNVIINMQKCREELEREVLKYEPHYHRPNYVEIDHSKYDKSQQWTALRIEWFLYQKLGLDMDLCDVWKAGAVDCVMQSTQLGIKLWSILQRRSGTATTALGNSMVTLFTLGASTDFPHGFYYVLFLGDDSLVAVPYPIDDGKVTNYLSGVFNLSSKIIQSPYGRFCSMYVVRSPGGVKLMSCPIKRIEKLGGPMVAQSEEEIRARYVSLGDTLFNYDDELAFPHLEEAVNYHYKCNADIKSACHALYTVSRDYDKFRMLYEKDKYEIHF